MPAKFIPIGEPAHDAERQGLRFLVDGLPEHFTVYGNPWLVEPGGAIHELDAVVVAPRVVFIVELKAYRGRIEGTDHDWYVPDAIRSPLKLNRLTAQVLKSILLKRDYLAGHVWIEGFVFLTATTDVAVTGPASRDRVHTRRTILSALQDEALVARCSGGRELAPTDLADRELHRLFTGLQAHASLRPARRVREYEVMQSLDHQEAFTELLARHALSDALRVLRIYTMPMLASEEKRQQTVRRARWEAQVLGRLGRIDGIVKADPPFEDEIGIVIPLEAFNGVSLPTWLERYGPAAAPPTARPQRADLVARTDLWMRLARAIDAAHREGVVHRLLRPDVILVEDSPTPTRICVTGFDLAKQTLNDAMTAFVSTLASERLAWAAPEVIQAFSTARPASDQFSLGALLALLLTGRPLFNHTRELVVSRRLPRHVRDVAGRIPLSLDEAVTRMLALSPTARYPSIAEAVEAVRVGRDPEARVRMPTAVEARPVLDPDALAPGTRIGADYEITGRLGQGGMAVVYAARHLVSGRTRALKVSRPGEAPEAAMRGEYDVLSGLDHPNIVQVIDLTNMVEGRLTLVMERIGGSSLRAWLAAHPTPEPAAQRRLAEDLLAGLEYLEQKGITHKDLKPDNLLVCDGRLVVIDFSLAALADDALAGTALYRDPAGLTWTHSGDRFAAALCLFELYAGRHAFDGRVPEPGEAPLVGEDDIDPSGLAAFFRKALDPVPERRFPSARLMREALLLALGEDVSASAAPGAELPLDPSTPLGCTPLSRRAVTALACVRIHAVGDLLALAPHEIRAVHSLGTKAAAEAIALRETLLARGVSAPATPSLPERPLLPELADSPEPLRSLPLAPALLAALEQAGLPTVGSVASRRPEALLDVPGVGRARLAQVVEALHQHRAHVPGADAGPHTLDRLWDLASAPLTEPQRVAVERCVGLAGPPGTQAAIAGDLGRTQPQVSNDLTAGLQRLDASRLAEADAALEGLLDGFGGVARLDELGRRFEEAWPAGVVTGEGLVRLLVRISAGRSHRVEVDDATGPVVARPAFDRETLRAFVAEAARIAAAWPPIEPETAARMLAGVLPGFDGSPVDLALRLCPGVEVAETGHLFRPPLDPGRSLEFVLGRTREPVAVDELPRRVRDVFGSGSPCPGGGELLECLRGLDCQIQGGAVIPGRRSSVVAPSVLKADDLPLALGAARSPEETVADALREAARSRGFRMLVTPPERHPEIGRSVAAALGAPFLSFEEAFFSDHAADLPALERAERFVAQREALAEAAEETLFGLLEAHGRSGRALVLGDTALLGLCEALDLPRRLYDETLGGQRGFWVLVVPGIIHNRQPRFNEGAPMWHLEGATLPLLAPLPAAPSA